MASFLRRFVSTASAGKKMYLSLAVASAIPVYTVLNESSKFAPPNSRANVFVSYSTLYLRCYTLLIPHPYTTV